MITTILWRQKILVVYCARTEESAMSRKLIFSRWRLVGSTNTRLFKFRKCSTMGMIKLDTHKGTCTISAIVISRGQFLLVMLKLSSDTLGNENAETLTSFSGA